MKTTILKIQDFVFAAETFLKNAKEDGKAVEAVRRVVDRVKPPFKDYFRLLADIKLTLANTDKNGSLLYNPNDPKEFAYTKEGYKELLRQTEVLNNEERHEIEPIIIDADLIPKEYHNAFEGFIINTQKEE